MNLKTRCEGKDIQVINKKALNRAFLIVFKFKDCN